MYEFLAVMYWYTHSVTLPIWHFVHQSVRHYTVCCSHSGRKTSSYMRTRTSRITGPSTTRRPHSTRAWRKSRTNSACNSRKILASSDLLRALATRSDTDQHVPTLLLHGASFSDHPRLQDLLLPKSVMEPRRTPPASLSIQNKSFGRLCNIYFAAIHKIVIKYIRF